MSTLLAATGSIAWAQSFDIPTRDLRHPNPAVTDEQRRAAVAWSYDAKTIVPLRTALRRFFGGTTGLYVADTDLSRPTSKLNGQPLVIAQIADAFGVNAVNNRLLPSGYRVLVSTKPHEGMIQSYVVTVDETTDIAVVGLVYFYAPPGGLTPTTGPSKGVHLAMETQPSLVFFYPDNGAGRVTRLPDVEKTIIKEVDDYFFNLNGGPNDIGGEPYHLKVSVRAVQSAQSDKQLPPSPF